MAAGFKVVPQADIFPHMEEVNCLIKECYPAVKNSLIYVQSKPLQSLVSVAFENLLLGQEGGCSSKIAARMNYIETALLSIASALYNFTAALAVTCLAIGTLGLVDCLNYSMKKHWLHTAMAVSGVVISLIGAASPLGGMATTGALVSVVITRIKAAWQNAKLPTLEERAEIVKSLYQHHRADLVLALEQMATDRAMVSAMVERMDSVVVEANSVSELFSKGLRVIFQHSA